MGLDAATTVNALGIAGSQAGGLLEFLATGSSTKQLHPGLAGQSGILAARLAAAGADGPASVLEGERGLYAALADTKVRAADVVDGLGERWECSRVTIKPYPSCQLMHAALDAVRTSCRSTGEVDERDRGGPPRQRRHRVRAAGRQARAADGVRRQVLAPLEPGRPGRRRRASRVDTYTDAGTRRGRTSSSWPAGSRCASKHFPGVAADAPGRVVVRLADGEVLDGSVPRSAGGPDHPLDDAAFLAKLAGNVGDVDRARALAAAVEGLAKAPDLEGLLAWLT